MESNIKSVEIVKKRKNESLITRQSLSRAWQSLEMERDMNVKNVRERLTMCLYDAIAMGVGFAALGMLGYLIYQKYVVEKKELGCIGSIGHCFMNDMCTECGAKPSSKKDVVSGKADKSVDTISK